MNKVGRLSKLSDKFGICASGLCLIHCLATPILLFVFPVSKLHILEKEGLHQGFAVLVISSILIALYPTCKKHGHKDIIVLASLGICFVLSAIFIHQMPEILGHSLTVTGSILLIIAHIKNMRIRHGRCETPSNCATASSHKKGTC